jgi:predicted nucleic acid-binding protein
MKVLFDANVIVDICEERESFFANSLGVFFMAVRKQIEGIICAGSITDIYYIVSKFLNDREKALNSIQDILMTLTLVDTKAQDIRNAISFNFSDFEDAVVSATAQREDADYIITRNTKDFIASPVPAITPEVFLAKIGEL